jgi:hypothetical protein
LYLHFRCCCSWSWYHQDPTKSTGTTATKPEGCFHDCGDDYDTLSPTTEPPPTTSTTTTTTTPQDDDDDIQEVDAIMLLLIHQLTASLHQQGHISTVHNTLSRLNMLHRPRKHQPPTVPRIQYLCRGHFRYIHAHSDVLNNKTISMFGC